jgi:hypothetical protein
MPVPPKPASKRRRRNVPKSYGLAEPTTAPAAQVGYRALGFDAHPLVADLWAAILESVEARFYSEADWQRARMELWYAHRTMSGGRPSAVAWAQIQRGLTELLVSPAAKRRVAIGLKPCVEKDPDEVAAVSMMSTYKSKLKPVDSRE